MSSRSSTVESTSSSNFSREMRARSDHAVQVAQPKHIGVRLPLGPAHVPGITRREGEAIGIAQDGLKVPFVGNRHVMEERRHPIRAGQQRVDGTGREAHPRAACVDRHPWPAALGPPTTPGYHSSNAPGKAGEAPRAVGSVEYFSAIRSAALANWSRAVEVPVPVRVAAPALGPVAGTVASEQRVGVSPDVVGRQFGLETADVPEGVVLAAEHHYVGTALAQGLTEHVHKKVHQLAAPPVERPLAQTRSRALGNLAVVERRVPLVVMQEHPALRVVFEQPAGPAGGTGKASGMRQCSRRRSLPLNSGGRAQARNYTLDSPPAGGRASTRSVPARLPVVSQPRPLRQP